MPSGLFQNFPQLLGREREKQRMALPGFLPGENLRWSGTEQGDQLRQRGGQLMLHRHLADPRKRRIRQPRIGLPKDVEPDVLISRIGRVLVSRPVGRVAVELHIPGQDPAIRRVEGGPQKIRTRPVVPGAGGQEPDPLPGQSGQWVPDQLLKPDPLQDRFRQNRPRLLPQQVCPHPAPISQGHKD